MEREDPPPKRVMPASLKIVRECQHVRIRGWSEAKTQAVANMCPIGFFWLSRPNEATDSGITGSLGKPFRLCDTTFMDQHNCLQMAATYNLNKGLIPTITTLNYPDQKNGLKNESVSQSRTTESWACPAKSVHRQTLYLRRHNASPTTPLCSYKEGSRWRRVTSRDLTTLLRAAAKRVEGDTGISHKLINSRSLRAGGATALLCTGVPDVQVQYMGRWQSQVYLRYFHTQATPVAKRFAQQMVDHGDFHFSPGHSNDLYNIPVEAPREWHAVYGPNSHKDQEVEYDELTAAV